MIKKLTKEQVGNKTHMSSFKGRIGITYEELIDLLGEPTFIGSGDNKVQFEWVVMYKGEVFTIYDWKTYDREYTINELDTFRVGGHSYAGDFINELFKLTPNIKE